MFYPHKFTTFPLVFLIAVCQYIVMVCLFCHHDTTRVVNSRHHSAESRVWRRRRCETCQAVFTTYEKPSLDDRPILQNNSQTDAFNIGRLIISISRSFQHDTKAAKYASLHLAETVESKLIATTKPLSTDDITAITYETIRHYDPVAGVQYAAQHDLVTSTRRPGRPSISFSYEA